MANDGGKNPLKSPPKSRGNSAGASTATAATPWGKAVVLERVSVPQRAGEKRFAAAVELLADAQGERLIRFAYSTGGAARRGPLTLRTRDLDRLRKELSRSPELAALLLGDPGGGA